MENIPPIFPIICFKNCVPNTTTACPVHYTVSSPLFTLAPPFPHSSFSKFSSFPKFFYPRTANPVMKFSKGGVCSGFWHALDCYALEERAVTCTKEPLGSKHCLCYCHLDCACLCWPYGLALEPVIIWTQAYIALLIMITLGNLLIGGIQPESKVGPCLLALKDQLGLPGTRREKRKKYHL